MSCYVTDYRGSHYLVTHHVFLDIVYLTTVVPSYYLRLTTSVLPSIFRCPYFPRVYIDFELHPKSSCSVNSHTLQSLHVISSAFQGFRV